MRKFTYLLLISIIFSCSKKDDIIGTWVEKDNFNLPVIIEFDEDFFYNILSKQDLQMYKLKNDTFITQRYGFLEKMKFNISGNSLSFYNIESDSLLVTYERLNSLNFIDYFNEKLNANINLVNYASQNLNPYNEVISLYLDKDLNNETILYINGKEATLDSLLYLKLFNRNERYWESKIYVFVDNELPISELNKVKIELRKAMQFRISYITSEKNGYLFGTHAKLPPIEFDYPDSIDMSLFPPPPPKPIYPVGKEFFNKSILLEVYREQITLNDTLSSFDNFKNLLETKLINGDKPIVHFYIDEQLEYERYIKLLIDTKNIYYSLRNQFSKEYFNENDYNELHFEKSDSIVSLFPMMINEIEIEELQEIKKYAL